MIERRHELGLSPATIGLSPATIRRVECAAFNPSFRTLVKMAKALGMMIVKDWPSESL